MKHARSLLLALGLLLGLAALLLWPTRRINGTGAAPEVETLAQALDNDALRRALTVPAAPATAQPEAAERVVARGRVRGRFVDFHTGESIEGAIFHVRHRKGVTRSDERGEFHAFEGQSSVEFEAGAEGYCVTRGTLVAAELDGAGPFEIPLVAASPVFGIVVDPEGFSVVKPHVSTVAPAVNPPTDPVPDGYPAGWRLYPEGLGGLMGAEDGTFALAGLVPGSTGYELRVARFGFQKATLTLAARGPGITTRVQVVLQHAPRPPSGSISGHTYLNGAPVESDVWFLRDASGPGSRARVEAEDHYYAFASLEPGRGRLLAVPSTWTVDPAQLLADPWIQGGDVELTVVDGAELVQDLWLSVSLATIAGRVRHAPGSTLEDGPVFDVTATSPRVQVWGVTDAEGRFALEVPVTGDTYRVQAGVDIAAPFVTDVVPGTSDLELVLGTSPSFTLSALDAETGVELHYLGVQVRRSDAAAGWFGASGPPYRAPAGPLDIRVRRFGYEAKVLQVHVRPGHGNHFVAALTAQRR